MKRTPAIGLGFAAIGLLLVIFAFVARSGGKRAGDPSESHQLVKPGDQQPDGESSEKNQASHIQKSIDRFKKQLALFEKEQPNEQQLIESLIQIHSLLISDSTRKDALERLTADLSNNRGLKTMLIASLLGGFTGSDVQGKLHKLLESDDPKVLAWVGTCYTLRDVDTRPPTILDRLKRLRSFHQGGDVLGFILKDYEFFWQELLWDITRMYPSFGFSRGFQERYDQQQPAIQVGTMSEAGRMYTSSYHHELADLSARKRLVDALHQSLSTEDRVPLFNVLLYRSVKEPWPDMESFCRLAARNPQEDMIIRYDSLGVLSKAESPAYLSVFRDVLQIEVVRHEGDPAIARRLSMES